MALKTTLPSLEPPEPATVSMAAVHRVEQALILHRVVPRYQPPITNAATREVAAVPPLPVRPFPTTLPARQSQHFCILCGALVPPWRDACFIHDLRQGRGLPGPARLLPMQEFEHDQRLTLSNGSR
jgi:hypothetical protein